MKGPISLSLADELRAIRGGTNSRNPIRQAPEQQDHEAPWQPELDQVQHTLQEVLQAVSQFSGVDLPGGPQATSGDSDSAPGLECNTLKDRIRNDLEAFSVRTTAELSRQVEEQARAALGELQDELNTQLEQATGKLREKLQEGLDTEQIGSQITQQSRDRVNELVRLQTDKFARWVWLTCQGTETPTSQQIQKLLEPYVEEATATYADPIRQKVRDLIAEQEQLVQERLQTAAHSVQSQLSSLEGNSLQVCQENADSVAEQSAGRLNALADEVVKGIESRIGAEVEGTIGRFQARLAEASSSAETDLHRDQDVWAENFRQRLGEVAVAAHDTSMTEMSARLAQTTADLIESSVQHLHHQTEDALTHSQEEISAFMKLEMDGVQQQIRDMSLTAHQALDRELAAASDRHISASRERLDTLIQESTAPMEERIRQAVDLNSEEITRMVRESQHAWASQYEVRLQEAADSRFDSVMARIQQEADHAAQRLAASAKAVSEALIRELSDKANASVAALKVEAEQVSHSIESTLQQSLEAHRQQLAQITQAGLAEQKEAMSGNVEELHSRLKQAAELLIASVPKAQ